MIRFARHERDGDPARRRARRAARPGALEASPLYNHDLAPVAVAKRTWTTWDYAALWISMAHCIPTYTLASGDDRRGHGVVAGARRRSSLGNLIVLAPILLNSHPGTKYGIPFPVFARAAYGTTARTCRR